MSEIVNILANYKIKAELIEIKQGAILQQIFVKLAPGMKYKTLLNRFEDIKRELRVDSLSIRTESGLVVFEIPQNEKKVIDLMLLIQEKRREILPICLGVDTSGAPFWTDLAKAPHLLVAGTTGSGKSVGLNCFLMSLIKNKTPEELKLLIIDPKRVEFTLYKDSDYLLQNPATDEESANNTLDFLLDEMESRYKLLEENRVKNINDLLKKGVKIPFLVCVIDEFADLILSSGRAMEKKIQSLAQKARACGIHLILATQRPSVDVVTGVIKANFPTRISYKVATGFDSKTVLDSVGAENLMGRGDSLFLEAGKELKRVHCAFIQDSEISDILQPFFNPKKEVEEPKESNSIFILDSVLSLFFSIKFIFFLILLFLGLKFS